MPERTVAALWRMKAEKGKSWKNMLEKEAGTREEVTDNPGEQMEGPIVNRIRILSRGGVDKSVLEES